ncbi:MAG: EFR1 family ferrodoxin [Candidatus Omnitrophica bacterium]|jgi:ferredoxin/flavodoxin|nr:EFR1 family ferrodoxin [Candidatus Omnitrophota bacterium]
MNNMIFYFTGTGNSLEVARSLAKELGDTQLCPIATFREDIVSVSSSCIGIVFPVYMFGLPLLVRDFIDRLEVTKGSYIFAVATYGGKAGNALGMCKNLFEKRNLELSSAFLIRMPGNYTALYGAIKQDEQDEMFVKADKRVKEISSLIKDRKILPVEKDMGALRFLFSFLYKVASPKIPKMDKGFWAEDKCNHCGTCVKVCPVKNIQLQQGKPKWLGQCQQCMACLQWCPVEAIQYGKSTIGKKRYRNPAVDLKDLINM